MNIVIIFLDFDLYIIEGVHMCQCENFISYHYRHLLLKIKVSLDKLPRKIFYSITLIKEEYFNKVI